MADFLKDIWEAIPGDNAATKWATLAAIAAVIMFVGWIFGLFTKPKKPDPDTAHTEAVAGGATEKLAEKLIEQANRAQAAESEAGALRGQVDEQENQISALTEAIESLQERRQEKGRRRRGRQPGGGGGLPASGRHGVPERYARSPVGLYQGGRA
jgi:hypothetical protein